MDDLRIAAVCMQSVPGDVAANLNRMDVLIREAAAHRADVVCFPELCVTGYVQTSPHQIYGREEMERILDRLHRAARDTNTVVLAGLIEVSEEAPPYIVQVISGSDGLIGAYRKTHLGPPEAGVYRPGDRIDVFRTAKLTLGVQLCYEAHFPEITTRLALMGADVVFIPHASPRGTPEEKLESWMRHLPARAFDNGLFVVACNPVGAGAGGLTFPGVAVVLGPDGRVLAQYAGMEERILFADLSGQALQEVRTHRMKYFLRDRRPSLYGIA